MCTASSKGNKKLSQRTGFGVLDVSEFKIIRLEMVFDGQRIDNLDGGAYLHF